MEQSTTSKTIWSTFVKPAYDSLNWDYWFGQMDARPLGVFRIIFALLLLKDAIYRLLTGSLYYSDNGIAPRHLMATIYREFRWSLMDYFGADWQVTLFFLLWIVVLICLLLGYQTRLMTIFNWILIVSLHERNILLLNGADSVMRVMSIWMVFLPLGRAYSLDRYLKPDLPETALAFPLRMIQLQFAFIYLSAFIFKAHGNAWLDGSAVYLALQLRSFTHPIADWMLASAPYVLFQIGTWFALIAEGVFFVFMFLPFEQPNLKAVGMMAMASVHIGIGVLMAIPNFSMVMLACYLLFFDGTWLVWLGKKRFPRHNFKDIPVLSPTPKITWRQWLLILVTGTMLFNVYAYSLYFMRPTEKSLGLPISITQLQVIQWTGLWQTWDMFAPNPFATDGGMLVMGTYESGRRYELRTGLAHDDELPRFYFGVGGRWKKYDENLYHGWYPTLIDAHAQYRCRTTPASPIDGRLTQVELIYRSRQVNLINAPVTTYEDQSLWTIGC